MPITVYLKLETRVWTYGVRSRLNLWPEPNLQNLSQPIEDEIWPVAQDEIVECEVRTLWARNAWSLKPLSTRETQYEIIKRAPEATLLTGR